MEVENMNFAAHFRYLRKRAGLTQEETAKKLGYSTHTTIFKIENGKQEISIQQIPAVCRALQCTPFELLGIRPEGDYMIAADPGSSEMLFDKLQRLPVKDRKKIEQALEILINGIESGGK